MVKKIKKIIVYILYIFQKVENSYIIIVDLIFQKISLASRFLIIFLVNRKTTYYLMA